MSKHSPIRPFSVSTTQRAGAGFLGLLLLALNLLAFAPAAHAWLHQPACAATSADCSDSGSPANPAPAVPVHHDDACAVMLFSQGIDGAPAVLAVLLPAQPRIATPSRVSGDLLVPAPQHRLPASQAPPTAA